MPIVSVLGFLFLQALLRCLLESVGNLRLLFGVVARGSVWGFVRLQSLLVEFFGGCFGQVVLQAVAFWSGRFAGKLGNFFHVMVLVLGNLFRFWVVVLCPLVFVMALVFRFNLSLPESQFWVYDRREALQQ